METKRSLICPESNAISYPGIWTVIVAAMAASKVR